MARNDRKSRHRPSVLFALSHVGYLRNLERTMLVLVARGFDVHVAYGKEHEWLQAGDYDDKLLSKIELHSMGAEPELPADPIAFLRLFRDTMFFARREFRDAHFLRKRFLETKTVKKLVTPKMLSALEALPASDRLLIDDLLAQIDASHPASRVATQLVETIEPEVIVVSPYLVLFSREVEFAKVAREKGIRLVYAAASWDNLTTKSVIKVQPDLVAVWNEAMADEAATLHRVDRKRIRVTGAPVFDSWFDRRQAWDRQSFLDAAGFDADRPILLYVCSSSAIGGNELDVVDRWVNAVRSCPDPLISDANILVRPHPVAIELWQERINQQANCGTRSAFRIFPTAAAYPTKEGQRAEFFNSIHHASAVVGLNTSAMIEAAILDTPVLTFKGHESEQSQIGNLHFRHLLGSGCVHVADELKDHLAGLATALRQPEKASAARKAFVRRFVRPMGLDQAPSAILAELIARQANGGGSEEIRRAGRLQKFRAALLGEQR
jgi:hypothetical protein